MKLSHIHSIRNIHLALVLAASTLLAGCATKLTQPITGYTCCNLRPDYGWVSSTNML
ncbi:ABC-type uncharacterized transport system auxiliary subunit, partial [Variovorax sp. 3319]|nr:ABC-type uncharacterized transport system auxiliary subunit [Variovorax sp. 3319]